MTTEAIKYAREVREHAWLARLRKGNASMSADAAQDIARYIDKLLHLVDPYGHEFYHVRDDNIPRQATDGHGGVVLKMCKLCGQAEAELADNCPAKTKNLPAAVTPAIEELTLQIYQRIVDIIADAGWLPSDRRRDQFTKAIAATIIRSQWPALVQADKLQFGHPAGWYLADLSHGGPDDVHVYWDGRSELRTAELSVVKQLSFSNFRGPIPLQTPPWQGNELAPRPAEKPDWQADIRQLLAHKKADAVSKADFETACHWRDIDDAFKKAMHKLPTPEAKLASQIIKDDFVLEQVQKRLADSEHSIGSVNYSTVEFVPWLVAALQSGVAPAKQHVTEEQYQELQVTADGGDGRCLPSAVELAQNALRELPLPKIVAVGNEVRYWKGDFPPAMVGGVIAEIAIEPLTGRRKVRVVDLRQDMKDPDVGRWVEAWRCRRPE